MPKALANQGKDMSEKGYDGWGGGSFNVIFFSLLSKQILVRIVSMSSGDCQGSTPSWATGNTLTLHSHAWGSAGIRGLWALGTSKANGAVDRWT